MTNLANEQALAPIQQTVAPTLQKVLTLMAEPSLDVGKLHDLLDFAERLEQKEAEKVFNRDYAAASLAMPKITKQGCIDMGSKGQIAFARYEDIDRVLRPIESQYGFARMFATAPAKEPGILMTLILSHIGGHSIRSERFMPPDPGPGRNNMQAIGSASSYAKRYLTLDIWNIITEGQDDDGNASAALSEDQVLRIFDMMDEMGMQRPSSQFGRFLKFMGTDSVEAIQQNAYETAMSRLRGLMEAKERR